ncbi:MAG TPA: MBL fold metallo-hydrolase [Candidatus Thermoplasmatota archaeon]|nr:MBL fold metallo-hydrolase [Candidatus Thermoplasmatota archaeon]
MSATGRFLGAAEDIGRLGFVLDSGGSRFLFDYGLAPDKPPLYPLECPPVDAVFLTHAHLDHSGMIPWVSHRYDAPIFATPPTSAVATVMHRDSLKIARMEGFPEPYGDRDIEATIGLYEDSDFRMPRPLGDFTARFHSAGHIPGAQQVELEGDGLSMVFTGDLYTRPQRLVGPAKQAKCDVLFMESTYAGREHPERSDVEKEFIGFIEATRDRGGLTIAPSFAVGRAQELCMVLEGEGFNVWLDGMAREVARIYHQHPGYLRDAGAYARAMRDVKFVRNHRGRSVALEEADVIITTGGMMDGGPVLFYLDAIRNDPRCSVAISGYQVRGSNGRRLLDDRVVDFDLRQPATRIHPVQCEVRQFDFSAHAGHSDLVQYARATGCEKVVLFHGDKREDLVGDLSDFAEVLLPIKGEHFRLD